MAVPSTAGGTQDLPRLKIWLANRIEASLANCIEDRLLPLRDAPEETQRAAMLELWAASASQQRKAARDKITELRARQSRVRDKLTALQAAGEASWRDHRSDVEAAVKSLDHALRSLRTSL